MATRKIYTDLDLQGSKLINVAPPTQPGDVEVHGHYHKAMEILANRETLVVDNIMLVTKKIPIPGNINKDGNIQIRIYSDDTYIPTEAILNEYSVSDGSIVLSDELVGYMDAGWYVEISESIRYISGDVPTPPTPPTPTGPALSTPRTILSNVGSYSYEGMLVCDGVETEEIIGVTKTMDERTISFQKGNSYIIQFITDADNSFVFRYVANNDSSMLFKVGTAHEWTNKDTSKLIAKVTSDVLDFISTSSGLNGDTVSFIEKIENVSISTDAITKGYLYSPSIVVRNETLSHLSNPNEFFGS